MSIVEDDKKYVWHPYTQHGKGLNNIHIVKGTDSLLIDENGKEYIDIVSSWWVNLHGHSNPYIAQKVSEQLLTLEHTIFAGFTHEPAVALAGRLLKILPENQSKIFYSDNGSTAVEVAVKMAIQYWQNRGKSKKKIIAFHEAYHGDTFGAMSVSGRSAFNKAFDSYLFDVEKINPPFPGMEEETIAQLKELIRADINSGIAAFIYEPLVMGTAGMKMYSPDVLNELLKLCKEHGILCIADEVMTGFGRTSKFFASEYMDESPDIMCLSKGLTGGTMPMGVTSCTEDIFNAFYSLDVMKTFFHGHSYTANPLGCASGLASLELLKNEKCLQDISRISHQHKLFVDEIKDHKKIINARCLGTIMAVELQNDEESSYFNKQRDFIYNYFLEKGILARPLGNTIYAIPPYCTTNEQLKAFYDAIRILIN